MGTLTDPLYLMGKTVKNMVSSKKTSQENPSMLLNFTIVATSTTPNHHFSMGKLMGRPPFWQSLRHPRASTESPRKRDSGDGEADAPHTSRSATTPQEWNGQTSRGETLFYPVKMLDWYGFLCGFFFLDLWIERFAMKKLGYSDYTLNVLFSSAEK